MKSKLIAILTAAIFVSGFGTVYAGTFTGDGSAFDIDVQATVVGAEVNVTKNTDPLNFGSILPPGSGGHTQVFIAIDAGDYVNGTEVEITDPNPAAALSRATSAQMSTDNNDFTSNPVSGDVADYMIEGTPTPAGFTMSTNYDTSVNITISDTVTLVSDVENSYDVLEEMDVTNIRDCSNVGGTGTGDAVTIEDDMVFVWIGGVLEVGRSQFAASYSATGADGINVTLDFE